MKKLIAKYIEPTALVSWPVFGISLGWAFFANFLDTLNNPAGMYLERVAAISLVHVVLFGLIYLTSKLTSKLAPDLRALVVFLTLIPLTAFRGLLLALLFTFIRGDDLSVIFYRSTSSIMVIGLPIFLASVVLHQIRTYSEARSKILDERERVQKLSLETRQQIDELSNIRVGAIKDLVLGSLPKSAIINNQEVIDAIGHTVENVVRPISHQLEREVGIAVPETDPQLSQKLDWAEAIKSAFLGVNISPKLIAFSFVITASTRLIFFQSPQEATYLITLSSIGSWLLLESLKKFLIRISTKTPRGLQSFLFVIGALGAGLMIGIATLPASTNSQEPLSLVFQAPFYLFGITALIALANSTRSEAALANERLEEATTKLSWEVARVLDEHRQLKRRLAKALHGPIQTQLMSSIIRLGKSGGSAEKTLEEIRSWLTSEFDTIEAALRSGQLREPSSLKGVFLELGETWEGLAQIELRGTVVDSNLLETDSRLIVTVSELIPELAFNAIKHGQATQVVFEISIKELRTLLLSCIDNGIRPPQSSRVGLGTKLLDECAIRWKRSSVNGLTKTEVELPFAGAQGRLLAGPVRKE